MPPHVGIVRSQNETGTLRPSWGSGLHFHKEIPPMYALVQNYPNPFNDKKAKKAK